MKMKRKLATIIFYLILPISFVLWLLAYVQLLDHRFSILPYWLYKAIEIGALAVFVGIPILIVITGISYVRHNKKLCKIVWIGFLIELILFAVITCFSFLTKPPESNKILFAEAMTAEQMSQSITQRSPGFYFITTWSQSGTVPSEEAYISAWIDFPAQYRVTDKLYYYPEKTSEYPYALKQLLKDQSIKELPAAIHVDAKGTVKIFNHLAWGPLLQSNEDNTLVLKDFLEKNYEKIR